MRRQVREALTTLPDGASLLTEALLRPTHEEETLRPAAVSDGHAPAVAAAGGGDAVASEDRLMCAIVDAL